MFVLLAPIKGFAVLPFPCIVPGVVYSVCAPRDLPLTAKDCSKVS